MKATIRYQTLTGYISPAGWLMVNGTSSKTRRNTYGVAQIKNGIIVKIEDQQQLSDFTNDEIAHAFVDAMNQN